MDGKPVEVGEVGVGEEVDKAKELREIYEKVYQALKKDKIGFTVKNLAMGAAYCAEQMLRKNERVVQAEHADNKIIITTNNRHFAACHPVFSFEKLYDAAESGGGEIMIGQLNLFWDLFDRPHMKLIRAHVSNLVASRIAKKLLPGEQATDVRVSTSVLECFPGKLEVVVQVQAKDASCKRIKVAYPLRVF